MSLVIESETDMKNPELAVEKTTVQLQDLRILEGGIYVWPQYTQGFNETTEYRGSMEMLLNQLWRKKINSKTTTLSIERNFSDIPGPSSNLLCLETFFSLNLCQD